MATAADTKPAKMSLRTSGSGFITMRFVRPPYGSYKPPVGMAMARPATLNCEHRRPYQRAGDEQAYGRGHRLMSPSGPSCDVVAYPRRVRSSLNIRHWTVLIARQLRATFGLSAAQPKRPLFDHLISFEYPVISNSCLKSLWT